MRLAMQYALVDGARTVSTAHLSQDAAEPAFGRTGCSASGS
jgi:hypothetical protein